jgi:hypothetical protein
MVKLADVSISGILEAGVVEVVQFSGDCSAFLVMNRSTTQSIFLRLDDVDPVVEGDGVRVVLPGQARQFGVPDREIPEIRLIAAEAAPYTIERLP